MHINNMNMQGDVARSQDNYNAAASIYKVQNWIKSCGETFTSQAELIRASSAPPPQKINRKRLNTKSKTSVASGKAGKSVTFPNQKWGATLKSSSMVHQCSNNKEIRTHSTHAANFPVQVTTSIRHIERPTTKRTCSCMSNAVTTVTRDSREKCVHGYLQQFNDYPIQQVAQRVSNTRFLLSGLKTEINKVKSQLKDISVATRNNLSRPNSPENTLKKEKEISILKLENVTLKNNLDQKNQQCIKSFQDVEKAKQVLCDYEKKVRSLHDQAIKSSKLIKQSKDKFCKCLKEKEVEIQHLKDSNGILVKSIKETEMKYKEINADYDNLRSSFQEGTDKLSTLTEDSKNFSDCIKVLEKQLDSALNETQRYKEEVKQLEEQILNYECKMCQKLEAKVKKEKTKLSKRIKEQEEKENELTSIISELSNELEITKDIKVSHDKLQCRCRELENQLERHEECVTNYQILQQKYQQDCDIFRQNEENYNKDREQLRHLVDELTNVVKQNKVTLLQLSAINKHQEHLLESQTSVISEKDDKLKLAESEIEILRKHSLELKEEVDKLRRTLTEPCKHESHLDLIDQLRDIRNALNEEIDRKLIKEKIIEDQSKTIAKLQYQINEKISELNQAREESSTAEEEIMLINEDLLRTHRELEDQLSKKEALNKKFKELHLQNSNLSIEVSELEEIIQQNLGTDQTEKIKHLQQQVKELKRECEAEKSKLRSEKDKAVEAAQFATQKLLDTVNDFQKQVGAQKKVQYLLTKMLHDKEADLRTVHKRLDSINSLTTRIEKEFPVNEIYKRHRRDISDHNTTSSFISSCSQCSRDKSCCRNCQRTKKQQLFELIITDEEPIKD